ncbi:EscI/YscI/HrpB family type III secretion system inner rod protein [Agarilytica rhodophyticola]|uniref:EscI/YscI/HrpB family type III secretion system inner rod protein n=1 Tax=Agarilytica rhodophyticola TaxID=1737490 RepID=UPI000B347A61|nr:EscI/YscI/HrpB family type III secretion system inner rod protein [Agarilytica rhodophyticola]
MKNNHYNVDLYQSDQSLIDSDVDEYSDQDFQLFDSWMEDDFALDPLDQLSNALLDKKRVYEDSVDKAIRTAETKDVIKATRNMSDYYLYTTMVAKVAQKSQSAIDKLTNLQ